MRPANGALPSRALRSTPARTAAALARKSKRGGERPHTVSAWVRGNSTPKMVGRADMDIAVVQSEKIAAAHSPPSLRYGGEGGIRTPDRLAPMPHFECGAFDHSATSPGATFG